MTENEALRADLAAHAADAEVGKCEACLAPLYAGDVISADPDGVQGCWHAMTDIPDRQNRPCYAYRVGKASANPVEMAQ